MERDIDDIEMEEEQRMYERLYGDYTEADEAYREQEED